MKMPAPVSEVFLQPGEWHFGGRQARVRTLLGSCVSITLWHPQRRIGGMCHYMLPQRAHRNQPGLDGKYADEAFALLLREVGRSGSPLKEFEAKLFGGGNMFPSLASCESRHVGIKNAQSGRALLDRHGLVAKAADLGGIGHRAVLFDIASGHVWVRQSGAANAQPCQHCSVRSACPVHAGRQGDLHAAA